MPNDALFTEVAALLGDTTRAAMLRALMDGRALTASELARAARVTPQTASAHLARMAEANLINVSRQGRHRYHRLASAAVARMIESIMQVAFSGATPNTLPVTGPRDMAMRLARTCYDHLAGRLGVAIADAFARNGHSELTADSGVVTASGERLLQRIGIDLPALAANRGGRARMLCRPCLDWSERRPHLAGVLGTALCTLSFEQDWVRRRKDTRAVLITAYGRRKLQDLLDVRLET